MSYKQSLQRIKEKYEDKKLEAELVIELLNKKDLSHKDKENIKTMIRLQELSILGTNEMIEFLKSK